MPLLWKSFLPLGMSETSLTARHRKKKLVISRLTERTEDSISLFLQRAQAREQPRAQQFPSQKSLQMEKMRGYIRCLNINLLYSMSEREITEPNVKKSIIHIILAWLFCIIYNFINADLPQSAQTDHGHSRLVCARPSGSIPKNVA